MGWRPSTRLALRPRCGPLATSGATRLTRCAYGELLEDGPSALPWRIMRSQGSTSERGAPPPQGPGLFFFSSLLLFFSSSLLLFFSSSLLLFFSSSLLPN